LVLFLVCRSLKIAYENFSMNCLISYILFSLAFSANYHPVHVSVLNIELDHSKPTIDFSFKVFTSDLELAIAHNYNVALHLGQPNESPESATRINKYVTDAFSLLIDNKQPGKFEFVKKEINEDAIWLRFRVSGNKNIRELEINNSLLMDIYEDQTNLIIVSLNGKDTGYRLNYGHREVKIKL
jgi:hypothetical protein